MSNALIRRPTSLREIAAESESYHDFGMNVKDFLHEYASARKRGLPLEGMFAEEPVLLKERFAEGNICDAFLAGLGDYLCRINRIQTPVWAQAESRVLEHPWFALEYPEMRLLLLRDTPSAFKEKNIFIFESAMNVA